MRPFLEQAIDLSREYAGFFAPYQHVADPLIDAAEEGMTTASIRSLLAELRSEWHLSNSSSRSKRIIICKL